LNVDGEVDGDLEIDAGANDDDEDLAAYDWFLDFFFLNLYVFFKLFHGKIQNLLMVSLFSFLSLKIDNRGLLGLHDKLLIIRLAQ
jgi:hypothetical protein